MDISTYTSIHLEPEEADVLKRMLGCLSEKQMNAERLTPPQKNFVQELYDKLPDLSRQLEEEGEG